MIQLYPHITIPFLPIPLYTSHTIGEMLGKDGEQYHVLAGIDQDLVPRLRELSMDDADVALQKYTSDRKRFGEGSYEDWYTKGRTPFVLLHEKTKDLAGLVWFGPKPLGLKSLKHLTDVEIASERTMDAGEWHTIVYRSYPKFRGRGLMKQFTSFAMEMYTKHYPDARLWAGMHSENATGDSFVSSLGFETLEEACDREKNWLVMVKNK